MLLRGLQVGLASGVGFFVFFFGFFSNWSFTLNDLTYSLGGGLAFGVMLGVGLSLMLLFLRLVDTLTGWKLADRLESAEPGVAGLIAGFLFTAPCMLMGALGLGYAGWVLVQNGGLGFGKAWGIYMALVTVPLGVLLGAIVGALTGTVAGNGMVGMLRGVGLLKRLD